MPIDLTLIWCMRTSAIEATRISDGFLLSTASSFMPLRNSETSLRGGLNALKSKHNVIIKLFVQKKLLRNFLLYSTIANEFSNGIKAFICGAVFVIRVLLSIKLAKTRFNRIVKTDVAIQLRPKLV